MVNYNGWLPQDPEVVRKWIRKKVDVVKKVPYAAPRADVIQEFQSLIENDPEIFMYFNQMFEQVPKDKLPPGVDDYKIMLGLFATIITEAPKYDSERAAEGEVVGVPIYAILDQFSNTPAGLNAFINRKVNDQFKKMFTVWAEFLQSLDSRYVLEGTPEEPAWPQAIADFADIFVCDPTDKYYGFKSWDDFFTRVFREGQRPVDFATDDSVVNSACDSTVYRIAYRANASDQFWLKGQPYSLDYMLNNDPLASEFDKGTVFQAFLSPLDYHRWHSPVNGKIKKIVQVEGTYYAASPDPELEAGSIIASQSFMTSLATRVLIFIESDNPEIGLMCFIGVGMVEVSTCEVTVKEEEVVKKGHQLGMFHFGGSTHCLIFRREVPIVFAETIEVDTVVRVNSAIARVGNSGVN
ncbi:phosphatidylserine decarboxylase-like protein [Leucogyrophana mollusca]|uniref:Phosphatidylserine decarboxylase-like protein n=1 Tax=Leucogyrophana mollusca TaxID=85980 RepID=A0ACB8BHH3_9AGAM|nr:phosphatidylserine decarboxylase-like protein [Leucogyrophana mollusca]